MVGLESGLASKNVRKINNLNLRNYLGWLSYDIANTFYATGILQFMIVTYVVVKGQEAGYSYSVANGLFYFTLSVASIFMAVMLPILGSISDVLNERKKFVIFFSLVTILTTFIFSFLNNIYAILIVFAISMITYQWAQVFYDAQLPGVVPPGREAELSSIAVAAGYLGGAAVILFVFLNSGNEPNGNPEEGALSLGYFPEMITMILVGFIIFSIPMFFVKETDWHKLSAQTFGDTIEVEENPNLKEVIKSSFEELWDTFKSIAQNNRGMFYYIVAYFIIADFANLIVLINTTYLRDGLGLPESEIVNISIVFGAGIILFSYFIGRMADKYGAKPAFLFIGVIWIIAVAIMIIIDATVTIPFISYSFRLPLKTAYILAILMGPAYSGVWICQRQMVLELVPTDQEIGRYFGLTKFSGKISSSIGSIVWGFLLFSGARFFSFSNAGALRFALFGMGVILVVGFIILYLFVPNKHDEYIERKEKMLEALNKVD